MDAAAVVDGEARSGQRGTAAALGRRCGLRIRGGIGARGGCATGIGAAGIRAACLGRGLGSEQRLDLRLRGDEAPVATFDADLDRAISVEHRAGLACLVDQPPVVLAPTAIADLVRHEDAVLAVDRDRSPRFEEIGGGHRLERLQVSAGGDDATDHVVVAAVVGIPEDVGRAGRVDRDRRRPVVGGRGREPHFSRPRFTVEARVEDVGLPVTEALPHQVQRAVAGARHLLIEVALGRRGQTLELSPVLAVEPAGVEIERRGEELLLRPDDPQPSGGVERERRAPDVAGHAGHRVPRAPGTGLRVTPRQPDLVATSGVADVRHPHVAAIGGVAHDRREVVGAGVVAHADHVVKPRVGIRRRQRPPRLEAERGPLGHRRIAMVDLEPGGRLGAHATGRVGVRGRAGVLAGALEQRIGVDLRLLTARGPRSRRRRRVLVARGRRVLARQERGAGLLVPYRKEHRGAGEERGRSRRQPRACPSRRDGLAAPTHCFAT
jgi:hypothetical protein